MTIARTVHCDDTASRWTYVSLKNLPCDDTASRSTYVCIIEEPLPLMRGGGHDNAVRYVGEVIN
jgi:hypothetical protein